VTYEDLINRIIADGIAEVREAYSDPKEHHKRDGAIEGFETCRGKAPSDLVALWTIAERQSREASEACRAKTAKSHDGHGVKADNLNDYWRQRYKALQIEWVCNVVSVGLTNNGEAPLFSHMPTARAAMKYAAIVGVHGVGAEA